LDLLEKIFFSDVDGDVGAELPAYRKSVVVGAYEDNLSSTIGPCSLGRKQPDWAGTHNCHHIIGTDAKGLGWIKGDSRWLYESRFFQLHSAAFVQKVIGKRYVFGETTVTIQDTRFSAL
jgi:hypothetical protein